MIQSFSWTKKGKISAAFDAFVSLPPDRCHPSPGLFDRKLIMKPTSCLMKLKTNKQTPSLVTDGVVRNARPTNLTFTNMIVHF